MHFKCTEILIFFQNGNRYWWPRHFFTYFRKPTLFCDSDSLRFVSSLSIMWYFWPRLTEVPSALYRRNLKTFFSFWKRIKCFPSTLSRRNLKMQQITGHFGFVFEENSGRDITWLSWRHRFRKACFQNVSVLTKTKSRRYPNSSGFKSVFEKLGFGNGLVWTVGITGEIMLRFQISPA